MTKAMTSSRRKLITSAWLLSLTTLLAGLGAPAGMPAEAGLQSIRSEVQLATTQQAQMITAKELLADPFIAFLQLHPDEIRWNQQPILSMDEGLLPEQTPLTPLHNQLQQISQNASLHGIPRLLIAIDQSIPAETITKVLQTASHAEYNEAWLLVDAHEAQPEAETVSSTLSITPNHTWGAIAARNTSASSSVIISVPTAPARIREYQALDKMYYLHVPLN